MFFTCVVKDINEEMAVVLISDRISLTVIALLDLVHFYIFSFVHSLE